MKNVKSIAIIGGGSAGLIAATVLRRRLNIKVDVIHSKNIGIIGVGEGSTEHFKEYMEFMNINQYDIIKYCDATYKSGIMFEGWGNKPYLHSIISKFDKKFSQYNYVYAKQVSENSQYFNYDSIWKNKINKWFLNKPEELPFGQFHFNTFKLNEFLINLSKSMGIGIIEDDIQDVVLGEDGSINQLVGSNNTYNYDFYIDATGFKRLLISKLGAKWQSYGKYLKMKAAITFQTPDTENYNLWTLAKAMDAGWLFRLPVWGRGGNGYIFDSDYITAEQAKAEVETYIGHPVEVGRQFNFDPGCVDRAWIKNCCAIGLSGSFVEPLEATSIGTSIQQAFLLMHRVVNYNDDVIDQYNSSFNDIMENIRDFIVLHYITKKTNTQFWRDVAKIEIPESLKHKLSMWKYKLPIDEDFNQVSNYVLFKASNHTLVMDGLDLFDRDAIKKEYDANYDYVKVDADNTIRELHKFENSISTMTHKEFISTIRNIL
jgi:flavin-dependent dehydrogenase